MGFPMTVERAINRNGVKPGSILADDIRRLAEDSVILYKQEFELPPQVIGYFVGRLMSYKCFESAEIAQLAARQMAEDIKVMIIKT